MSDFIKGLTKEKKRRNPPENGTVVHFRIDFGGSTIYDYVAVFIEAIKMWCLTDGRRCSTGQFLEMLYEPEVIEISTSSTSEFTPVWK